MNTHPTGRVAWRVALAGRSAELLTTLRNWPWFETLRTLRERFGEDRLGLTAGSLTFTTLIALVPLFTVTLALFSAFPMFASFQTALQEYFLQSLVPQYIAEPVLRGLTQFAGKASQLGAFGLILLGATALALVLTIDHTLNDIWRVRKPRSLAQRILVYWSALTLGPLALGVSLSATSYALSANRGLVATLGATTDPREKARLWRDVQRQLAEDAVNVFIWNPSQIAVYRKGLRGLWTNSPIFANDLGAVSWAPPG